MPNTTGIKRILHQLTANPKRLFLIDALGALLTAILLFAVVARFEDVFGMPQNVLCVLSSVACAFAVYSMCCFFFTPRNWRPYLKFIAIANLLYCCVTLVMAFSVQSITALGVAYFVGEVVVISGLASIELMAASKRTAERSQ